MVDSIFINQGIIVGLSWFATSYKELVNFKKEFKKEKNLWDKFLDILAGGTHQSPSERVMLDR